MKWKLFYQIYIFSFIHLSCYDPFFEQLGDEYECDYSKLQFINEPNLEQDGNGFYKLTLDRSNWQTLHRVSGHLFYDGEPVESARISWLSNLYWILGDTLGYIIHRGLTDDLIYVSYDTTYITGLEGMEVPTINPASYTGSDGEFSQMIAPVLIMAGDTMDIQLYYYADRCEGNLSYSIVLE